MATTENTYTGDGSTTSYSLTFQYIDESDIKVSLDGVTTTAYSLSNATTVLFDTAPASDVLIRIYRETDVDSLKTTFFAGSSIRAQDLNDNFLQNNYRTQELTNNTWDKEIDTIHSDETWVSNDTQIATTAAMDARFQDEATETIESTETWVSDDDRVPTTLAADNRIDAKINTALTSDIATDGTGITVTDDGDGTITLGLGSGSIDLDRIKAEDIITQSEQNADFDLTGDDDSVFTSSAAIRRFENYVQNTAPSGTGIGTGRVWVDVDDDLTLSVWNGSAWVGITSGGTFTNQPKVVYVDASSGDDDNDGHRISRPKATIKAAINQINADTTHGDGSVVIVAAGVYQEAAPIQIQKKNVSIIGQALRSCIVHPTSATETATLFELNSGSYVANLTLTGMQAGTGTGNTVDATLPTDQGWNFAFFSGATITKSPYIQNCTNFSDSEIDNDDLNANTPAGGLAGDTDSAPTGGGLLVDGSVVDSASPLRSMVCDSYTHVGLNGPGILVTNNGYVQATSSYAFFNKYHIKCLNGGQANLAASTTDFGDQALVADGRSSSAIFTSNVDGAASDGDTTFNINEPTAGTGWFGDTERPATNMLVEVNSVTYPILSATANTDSEGGAGWTVEISRPDPNNRSTNLGLNGAVSDNAAVSFFLRSMIASSGHTMEYVGSGTNYSALPENGGVPDESKQITESNNGKVWTAITDHNGKFKIGGNQTDDPIFEVDQQLGFVTIPEGSIAFNLLSDLTPQLGGNLDVNGNEITSASNGNVVINPNGTGNIVVGAEIVSQDTNQNIELTPNGTGKVITSKIQSATAGDVNLSLDTSGTGNIDVNSNRITSLSDPTLAQDAATKNYVDTTTTANPIYVAAAGDTMSGALAMGTNKVTGVGDPTDAQDAATKAYVDAEVGAITTPTSISTLNTSVATSDTGTDGTITFTNDGSESARIDSSGNLGIGTSSPQEILEVRKDSAGASVVGALLTNAGSTDANTAIGISFSPNTAGTTRSASINGVNETASANATALTFHTNADGASGTEKVRIDSSGNVGIGTTSPQAISGYTVLTLNNATQGGAIQFRNDNTNYGYLLQGGSAVVLGTQQDIPLIFNTGASDSERMRIASNGRVYIATTSAEFANASLTVVSAGTTGIVSRNYAAGGWSMQCGAASNSGTYYFIAFQRHDTSALIGQITSTNGTSTTYGTTSDYRLKENVEPLTGAINSVKQLQPKRFNFIENTEETLDGFLAHEVDEVVPQAVIGAKDAVEDDGQIKPQCIDHSMLVPLLTAALQEAIAKIETLEAKVAALESA